MRRVSMIVAVAASLTSSAALADDLQRNMGPQLRGSQYDPGAGMVDPGERSGWYLRGDIGVANDKVKNLDNIDNTRGSTQLVQQATAFDTAGIVGGGIGYQFNSWLRVDVTGQYRGNANFKGMDRFTYTNGGPGYAIDTYSTTKSAVVGLVNAMRILGPGTGSLRSSVRASARHGCRSAT